MPGTTVQLEVDRVILEHLWADPTDHLMGQHGTDNPIGVDDGKLCGNALATGQGRFCQLNQPIIQRLVQLMILLVYGIAAQVFLWLLGGGKDRAQIDALSFPVAHGRFSFKKVDPANHFIDGTHPERGHNVAHFVGDHEEVVHDMLWLPIELFT